MMDQEAKITWVIVLILYFFPLFNLWTVFWKKAQQLWNFTPNTQCTRLYKLMRLFTNSRFTISLNNLLPPCKVSNIQVRFGRSNSSDSPVTCITLAQSKLIRSNDYFLGSRSSIMISIQLLINLELIVLPLSIYPTKSKISQTSTWWWVTRAIAFRNGLFLTVDPSPDPYRPSNSDSFQRFLVCLYLILT